MQYRYIHRYIIYILKSSQFSEGFFFYRFDVTPRTAAAKIISSDQLPVLQFFFPFDFFNAFHAVPTRRATSNAVVLHAPRRALKRWQPFEGWMCLIDSVLLIVRLWKRTRRWIKNVSEKSLNPSEKNGAAENVRARTDHDVAARFLRDTQVLERRLYVFID